MMRNLRQISRMQVLFCVNCISYLSWCANDRICCAFWIPQKLQPPHAPRSGDMQGKCPESPTVSVASIHCEAQDNSLLGPIPSKGKQQPMPRNHVRKVLILKSLIFLQERRNPVPYCNQKKFQWTSCFTEILPWNSD